MTNKAPALLPLDAGEHYRFGFSMDSCIGCHSCEVACGEQNGLPVGTAWRRVGEIEGGAFPATKRFHLSMACNHCLEPACLEGCPTNAYEKLTNGVVQHHADECIGCQYCTWNCPYSVPAFQPDRRIVTKCDMCLPRLEQGLTSACVSACPTHAITVEKVNVAEWRADHRAADAPQLPSGGLTLSTTRIELPRDVPLDTYGGSEWNLRPEHPHGSLIAMTLITQLAVGASVFGEGTVAAVLAVTALAVALLHLGRPVMAWKALRNLRRSWLSREVALFGAFAASSVATVVMPGLAPAAAAIGLAGTYASGRLYIVPGRPAWDTPLTLAQFFATTVALGGLVGARPLVAVAGVTGQLAVTVANLIRLGRDHRFERRGTVRLMLRWFRALFIARVAVAVVGAALAMVGALWPAFVLVALGELAGRYLFFVTVVPLNVPGSFFSRTAR
jgi:Fe-S-cluster-containing dehydrogenase component/DMSO reductase anchor subunit